MSQMKELAAILDELTGAANQLRICAGDLLRTAVRLRASLTETEEPEEPEEPETPETLDVPKPRPRKSRPPKQTETPTEPEPPAEPEAQPEPEPTREPLLTKQELRAMLADLANKGHRDEAKALVAKYANGGSFSDIDPARYRELAEEVKQYA